MWIPALAEADPMYILPVVSSCSMFMLVQLGGDTGAEVSHMANSAWPSVRAAADFLPTRQLVSISKRSK